MTTGTHPHALPLAVLAALVACADSEASDPPDPSSAGITGVATTADDASGSDADDDDADDDGSGGSDDDPSGDGSDCAMPCDGGVCTGGVCCDANAACGDVCCGDAQVCSFGSCVDIGDECIDKSDCPDGYCEYALGEPGGVDDAPGCMGGASLQTGRCLPNPPDCPEGAPIDLDDLDCLPACEVHPPSSFSPELKFAWDGANVMMTPIVIQLDDDNCDGIVDERDIPELVVSTFVNNQYGTAGTIRALTIQNGALVETWAVTPGGDPIGPGHALAGGNIDGIPGNEIVACTVGNRVRAFRADGTELWQSAGVSTCDQPGVADLDHDGVPEIIVERAVLDGATGAVELTVPGSGTGWWTEKMVAADITGDGELDLVKPTRAWDKSGNPLVTGAPAGHFHAVADLDLDGVAEVVSIRNTGTSNLHHLSVWRYDPLATNGFTTIRTSIDINGGIPISHCPVEFHGYYSGGGPPVVADFNGDGVPDVGVAGGVGYAVFDGSKLMDDTVPNGDTFLWVRETQDCSSAFTGSSVFDFDGDGSAEVVYADEEMLRIYRGIDGEILYETCNTSGTLHEYPVIADVDNDAHADIVAVSNDYSYIECPVDGSKTRGVRIFGDDEGRWVRTRRVWNQHAYHVTNVEEDGSIPLFETPNWTVPGLNNFRQNVQPEGEFSAPDLVPRVFAECEPDRYALVGRVRNIGRAAVPEGVQVDFWAGDPDQGGTKLGTSMTTKVLYPAEAEDVVLELDAAPEELANGTKDAWVVVDDTGIVHAWQECDAGNNRASGPATCGIAG